MNNNGHTPQAAQKVILLEPGKTPQLIGAWTVGEVRGMAAMLTAWIDRLPLSAVPDAEDDPQAEQA